MVIISILCLLAGLCHYARLGMCGLLCAFVYISVVVYVHILLFDCISDAG